MPNKISFVESEMLRGMARGGVVDDLSKPSFRIAAPRSGKRRGVVPRETSVLDVPEGKERRIPDTVLRRPPTPPDTITGYDPSMAQRHAESLAGALTPKIGGPRAQAISQTLLGGPESALPLGIGLQELVPFSPYVAEDAGRLMAQGVQEGSPLTTGLGVGLGVLQASPAIGPLARGAKGVAQRAAAAADPEAIRRYVAATQGVTGLPGTAVVKPKGGNWLQGSVENALDPIKAKVEGETVTPEMAKEHWDVASVDLSRQAALNKWIDQKLNRYVKNEMATPEDPIRLLAQQRISHLPEDILTQAEYEPEYLLKMRKEQGFPESFAFKSYEAAGFPPEGEIGARMAGGWESMADRSMNIKTAGEYQEITRKQAARDEALANYVATRDDILNKFRAMINEAPGISEAEKESVVKGASQGYAAAILGRTDELKAAEQAVREASSYSATSARELAANPWINKRTPETPVYSVSSEEFDNFGFDHIIDVLMDDLTTGRIRPDQLKNITMEQAVRRVHEYDQEMAKVAANAATKVRTNLPVQKEYSEGYKWIELNRPGAFATESDMMGHSVRGYEPPKGHPDWTPESGDSGHRGYGHGGWEAIKSGRAKVYSLVDPQGKPHVTVEIKRGKPWNERSGIFHDNPELEDSWAAYSRETYQAAKERGAERDPNYIVGYPDWLKSNDPVLFRKYAHVFEFSPPEITQIKGKQNSAPDAKYRPFVQDFVRSGQWGRVGDLRNTGFEFSAGDMFDARQIETLKKAGFDVPNYMTRDEATRLQDELYKIETGKNPDTGLPLAAGGRVEAPEGAEDFIAQVQQRMQGQEQRMAGGGFIKKALGTLSKESDTLKPTFKMPGADMPLAKIPESAPKVTEKTVEVKPGGAKAQKVTQSVIETPLSRRQVIKTAGSQVAQKVIPRISTDIPQLTPEEMFGGVADMPGLYAAMLPLVRRVAPHELDSMAKRLGFSLEDIIEHSGEDILPRGELVSEGVTRFMELFPETSSKVLKKAGGGGVARNAFH